MHACSRQSSHTTCSFWCVLLTSVTCSRSECLCWTWTTTTTTITTITSTSKSSIRLIVKLILKRRFRTFAVAAAVWLVLCALCCFWQLLLLRWWWWYSISFAQFVRLLLLLLLLLIENWFKMQIARVCLELSGGGGGASVLLRELRDGKSLTEKVNATFFVRSPSFTFLLQQQCSFFGTLVRGQCVSAVKSD